MRVRCGQDRFPGLPAHVDHVLALSDLTPASKPAPEFALEVAECFHARLTLIHGGEAAAPQTASGGDDQDRARLLCLFWETQRRVLFRGILSTLILRGAMLGLGVQLVERFHEW